MKLWQTPFRNSPCYFQLQTPTGDPCRGEILGARDHRGSTACQDTLCVRHLCIQWTHTGMLDRADTFCDRISTFMLWSSINCGAIGRKSINGDNPYNCPSWCSIKRLFLSPADKLDGPSIWFYKAICSYLPRRFFMRPVMEKAPQVTNYCVLKSDTWFLQDSAHCCCFFFSYYFFPSHLC